jgi:SAM-dependent methyltransferase
MTITNPYPPDYFVRPDERDDALFFASPHPELTLDGAGQLLLTNAYEDLLPASGLILELYTGLHSYLPLEHIQPELVVGLGLNTAVFPANPQLDQYIYHNPNRHPALPFANDSFDAILCPLALPYLTQPLTLFQEVWRVLAPAGRFLLCFTNRTVARKTTAVWQQTDDTQHLQLVASYFNLTGPWRDLNARLKATTTSDDPNPLFIMWASKGINE